MSAQINTEQNFIDAPIGTVMRDRNKDVFTKTSERGAEMNGAVGAWGPTWVAYPADVLTTTAATK